jgi:pimeloyl-ACP methyl ester carboxylesterase
MSMTRPYVLGCSIGGKIALDMAVKASPRLSGVVAMEAAFARTADRRSRRILEDSASPSVRDGNYLMNLVLCGHLAKPERVEMIAQMHCREDWIVTAADVIGFRSHYLWDSLSSVACPVYLVVGEDGAIPREHSRGTADQIPGAHFEIVDGIGHYPMEEMDDFVERFAGWVRILAADVCQGRMGANAK